MTGFTAAPITVRATGETAFPGSVIVTNEPRPSFIRRAYEAITGIFKPHLPDQGGESRDTNSSIVAKTSPALYPYEIFRQEWERRAELRDLDNMLREDPRLARANRLLATTAVRNGITVTVMSADPRLMKRAQDVVNQVMRDCQINAKLAPWARVLLKAGDLFLNPVVELESQQVRQIKSLPAITMQRCEDIFGTFQDLNAAFAQVDPITLDILSKLPLFACNHIRWQHEESELYGVSQYRQLRPLWKKLKMTEEDLVVRRRTRAVQRRFHSVGNKENPGGWDEVAKYRAENQLDPNKAQITTDYFGNGLTDVKNLEGDAYLDHIKDIEHLQEVYMIGTGVPLHILGFGRNVNRDIVDNQERAFKESAQEIRELLEFGDSSYYSGLRQIFELALALQEINPRDVTLNFAWYASDNETAKDRITRAIVLRSAQPTPLISHIGALRMIARDINLENPDAINAEMEAIKAEGAQNPSKPNTRPLSYATIQSALRDSAGARKKKAFGLRTRAVATLEAGLARAVTRHHRGVLKAREAELQGLLEKYEHFSDPDHKRAVIRDVVQAVQTELDERREVHASHYAAHYVKMAGVADRAAVRDVSGRRPVADAPHWKAADPYVNPNTVRYLREIAGARVRDIDATTLDLLRKALSQAYEKGEDVSQWMARIQAILMLDKPEGRALTIARTELAWAYSEGLLGAYADIGVERLERLEIIDNRTCPECEENHGRIYTIADASGVLPGHPRCRGTWVAALGSY